MSEVEECVLCYDQIPIPVYEENNTEGVIYQGDVSRLQCGHAFHTRCILSSLQHRSACPLCNITSDIDYRGDGQWIDHRIRLDYRCIEILKGYKKSNKMKEIIREHKEKLKLYKSNVKEFKKRVKEFKTQLRNEMNIQPNIKEISKLHTDGIRTLKNEIVNGNSLARAASAFLPKYKLVELLFGSDARSFERQKNWLFR